MYLGIDMFLVVIIAIFQSLISIDLALFRCGIKQSLIGKHLVLAKVIIFYYPH